MAVTITLPPPLSAEIDSLRAQLSVARSQTKSDRELIAELRGALEFLVTMADTRPVFTGEGGVKDVRLAGKFLKSIDQARAVLGKVAP